MVNFFIKYSKRICFFIIKDMDPWINRSAGGSEDGLTLPLRGCVLAERMANGLPGSRVIPLARHLWVPGGWPAVPQVSWVSPGFGVSWVSPGTGFPQALAFVVG